MTNFLILRDSGRHLIDPEMMSNAFSTVATSKIAVSNDLPIW